MERFLSPSVTDHLKGFCSLFFFPDVGCAVLCDFQLLPCVCVCVCVCVSSGGVYVCRGPIGYLRTHEQDITPCAFWHGTCVHRNSV